MTIDVDAAPASPEMPLRLHLLSHRLAAPNTLNLDGIFGILNTAVWTDLGPVAVDEVAAVRMRLQRHLLHVHGVDKFRAWSTTSSVRRPHRRRLACVSVLTSPKERGDARGLLQLQRRHTRDVDGRGSDLGRVVVGDGSDVGGRASIMGNLSGGGKEQIRVGERCLLGANSASASASATTASWRPVST